MKRIHKRMRKGVSVVEVAIVLPVLVLLTFGMIEIGWLVDRAQVLHNAARQGARAARDLENSNDEVKAAVVSALSNDLGLSEDQVVVTMHKLSDNGDVDYQISNLNDNEDGEPIRVTVSVAYLNLSPPFAPLNFNFGSLSSAAVMQRQE